MKKELVYLDCRNRLKDNGLLKLVGDESDITRNIYSNHANRNMGQEGCYSVGKDFRAVEENLYMRFFNSLAEFLR